MVKYTDTNDPGTGNQLPIANAGADQIVLDSNADGSEVITLDGGLSSDPDGDNLTYSWKENTNVLGSGQSINHSFDVGAHVVTLTVNDGQGHEVSDTVIVTVNEIVIDPINIAPTAQGDTATVQAGQTVIINVLSNDSDSDGNMSPASVLIGTDPSNGIATVNPSGTITYSSDTETIATEDTLTYTVADTAGLISNEVTVTITITQTEPDNLPPVVVEDTATVQAGEAVTIDVLANDSVSDGTLDKSTLVIVNGPSSGTVEIDTATGIITYSHDGSASTSDSFSYTVEDDQGELSNEATVTVSISQDPVVGSCGKGIELDGINDWINIPNLSLNDFTIEGWFNLAPGIDFKDPLFGQEGSGPDIHFTAGRVRLYAYGVRVTANTALTADTWGHIAITRSGSDITVYVNGVKDATGRWNGAFSIKAIGRGNRGFVKGKMDEIRIWDIARTEAEISSSYDATVDPSSAGLIGYWGFNEADQIITDASSSANHGSLGVSTAIGADDPVRLDSTAPLNENCGDPDPDPVSPVANDDTVNPIEIGETISFSVTDNDEETDSTLDLSSVEIVSPPSAGEATVNTDGTITYQHTGETATTDTLIYTVKNTAGLISNEATVTFTITIVEPINVAPTANDDPTVSVEVGKTISFSVTGNDEDTDGNLDSSSVEIVSTPNAGEATVNTDGTITYEHTGNTATTDTLTYTVKDTEGLISNAATVTITVTEDIIITVPPIAVDDAVGPVEAGTTIDFTVTDNDTDADGNMNSASVVIVTGPTNGVATVNSSGTINYSSNTGTTATEDTLTYTVADTANLISNEATVTITITPSDPDSPPVAVEDTATVQAGEAVSIDVLANDSVSDGTLDKSTLLIVNGSSSGTVEIDTAAGIITYTHDGSTSTSDSFSYTVEDDQGELSNEATVTVSISQDPVVGNCGKGIELDGINDWINIPNLSLNDFTIEGWFNLAPGIDFKDPLFGQEGSGPDIHFTAGRVRLYAYGVRVTANTALTADTWGHIAITRSGSDITVYVNGVKDATGRWNGAFSIKAIGRGNRGFVKGKMDEIRIWDIARTETEISNSYDATVDPSSAGLIGYWGFNEADQIITDASSSANHGSLGVSTAIGADDPVRLDSTAPLNENCGDPDPDPVSPVANDDTVNPIEIGETISFSVTDNDEETDSTLDLSSVEIVSPPSAGGATVNTDGTITYQHTGETATTDTLIYTVKNTAGLISNEATVTFTITIVEPINVAPTANDDPTVSVEVGKTISFSVTGNDEDTDGNLDSSSVEIVSTPNAGEATVNTDGTITYEHTGTTATEDTLTYTVADTAGLISNEATVTITITQTEPDNLPPVVVEDTATVQAGEAVSIDVLANDSVSDGTLDKSTLVIVNGPSSGTVEIDTATGIITYSHDGSASTSDSFSYTVEDDQGELSNEATVTVSISQDPVVGSCGKGIELDGINDWINIPNLSLNDFTIEGWFNLAPGIDFKDPLFGQEGSGPDIHFTAGRVRLYAYGVRVTANTALTADTWGHIAITRSGSDITVYVNGVKDATGRWNGAFSIKAIGRGNRGFVKGKMDEIRIWDIARTETEISNSYDATVDPSSAGLIGYWGFNEADQIITDASSSANHGSLGVSTAIGADDPVRLDSTAPLNENCGDPDPDPVSPVANDDTVNPIEIGETISFSVTDNDEETDSTLDLSSVEIVSPTSAGEATVNTDGTITYQHTGETATTDTLIYTVKNTAGLISNEATVTFTITIVEPINVAPTANDDPTVSVEVGKTISFSVTGNDEDTDGNLDSSSVEIVSTPNAGEATVNTDGTITYEHTGNTATTDTLTYTVKDTEGLISNAATVTITVTEDIIITVPPIAVDDAVGPVEAGTTIDFTVTDNDTDADGNMNSASVVIVTGPTNGVATVNSSGTINYSSNTGTTATEDTLTYTVADTANLISNEATVTITITPSDPDSPPVAVEDTATVQAGEAVSIDVLANDSVSDGTLDKSTLLIVNGSSSGTVEIDTAAGIITYTHDGSTSTSDSFSYTVEDDQGELSNEATVTVSISQDPVVGSCGKGIELDGINDWINIPNLSLANDFTVESWVKLAPGIDNNDALFGQEGQGPDINFYASKVRLYAAGDKVTANTDLLPNTWEHIAITRSGTNLVLYINGVEDATGIWNGTLSLKAIGRGNRGYLKGELDEIRVWDIARSATEISNSYNVTVDPNSAGLIGYWGFNDASQSVTDVSSSANHGSLGVSTAVGTDDPAHLDSTAPFTEDCVDGNTGGNNTLSLHGLFSDHGVLQRGVEVPVWGTAEAGATVDVTFSGQSKSIVADNNGQWMVKLDPLAANATGEILMVTSGEQAETREDILVGEVWLASGQSNMAMIMSVADPDDPSAIPSEYGDASFTPSVRVLQMEVGSTSNQPSKTLSDEEKWKLSDKEGINYFSAVAYYFGRDLNQALNVPIGIISGTAGGTSVRSWMPESHIQSSECNDTAITSVNYNYSIAPLLPYALKGVIWYQGEANTTDQIADCYHDDFKKLIEGWRFEWANAANSSSYDFPFYFVQLPNYEAGNRGDAWVTIREQMLEVDLDTPQTEMVVTIDVGDANDVHPRKKLPVGKRLARIARAIDYGENLVYSGPVYKSIEISGDAAILSFDHIGSGLAASDNQSLKYFEIAGADGNYFNALAVIIGDTVQVSSNSVSAPVKVRYAWHTNPENPNFANQEGLMATPFRTDAAFFNSGVVVPVANDDTVGPVQAGSSISFTVTDNDVDSDGNIDLTSVSILSLPSEGTTTVDATGTITYTSTGTEAITDTFSYTVADTQGAVSNEATVTITVTDPTASNFEVMQSLLFDVNKPSNEDFLNNYNMKHLPELGRGQKSYWDIDGGENPFYDAPNELRVKELAGTATASTVFMDLEHLPTNFRDAWDHDGDHNTPAISITDSDRDRAITEMADIADWIHEANSDLTIGYYGVVPQRDYWSFVDPTRSAELAELKLRNQKFAALAEHVDVLFPSLYTFYNQPEDWKVYAKGMIAEAKKYNKPVYAFIWPQYHSGSFGGSFIDGAYWRMQLEELYALGIDGVVIWGGYLQVWDDSALDDDPTNWWYQTLDFMHSKGLLPANSSWSPVN